MFYENPSHISNFISQQPLIPLSPHLRVRSSTVTHCSHRRLLPPPTIFLANLNLPPQQTMSLSTLSALPAATTAPLKSFPLLLCPENLVYLHFNFRKLEPHFNHKHQQQFLHHHLCNNRQTPSSSFYLLRKRCGLVFCSVYWILKYASC